MYTMRLKVKKIIRSFRRFDEELLLAWLIISALIFLIRLERS